MCFKFQISPFHVSWLLTFKRITRVFSGPCSLCALPSRPRSQPGTCIWCTLYSGRYCSCWDLGQFDKSCACEIEHWLNKSTGKSHMKQVNSTSPSLSPYSTAFMMSQSCMTITKKLHNPTGLYIHLNISNLRGFLLTALCKTYFVSEQSTVIKISNPWFSSSLSVSSQCFLFQGDIDSDC